MKELIRYCDSLRVIDDRIIEEQDSRNRTLNSLVLNKNLEIEQWEGKFEAADAQIIKERKGKRFYQITTGVAASVAIYLGMRAIIQ